MAWKTVSTYTGFHLDEFSCEQLLQGLIDEGWLTEDEAEAVLKRRRAGAKVNVFSQAADEEMEEALSELRRGRKSEALRHLELFLGRDWIGVIA